MEWLAVALIILLCFSALGSRHTAPAKVVAKREDISAASDAGIVVSTYYVTFQFHNGERREFSVSGPEYGMLVEKDTGRLSFRGTRFLGFERTGGTI